MFLEFFFELGTDYHHSVVSVLAVPPCNRSKGQLTVLLYAKAEISKVDYRAKGKAYGDVRFCDLQKMAKPYAKNDV